MSGELDNAAQPAASSETAAPPLASDTQGSAPASVDTTANGQDEPKGEQPDKQSRRDSRAFAAQRRENRELHRTLGRMEAEIGQLRMARQGDQTQQQDGQPPRQERPAAPAAEAHAAYAEHRDTIIDRVEEAGDGIEGFDKVMETIQSNSFPGTRVMLDFLGETDKPAQVAQWLADNPSEARRISRMSDAMAVRALEKAEAKLQAKPAPKTTKAPAPLTTVGGTSRASIDPRTGPNNGSMDDYAKWRRGA